MTEINVQGLRQSEERFYALGRELQIRAEELCRAGQRIDGSEAQRLMGRQVVGQAQALARQAQSLLDMGRLLERVAEQAADTEQRLVRTAEGDGRWAVPPPATMYALELTDGMQDIRIT